MSAEVLSAAFLLLLVLDPFGNLPVVMSSLANVTPVRRRAVVLRECVFAYAILLGFMAGGRVFLQFLQLSETSLAIAGGIILFLIALKMVFPVPRSAHAEDEIDGEPLLVPLAVPLVAGPSTMAVVILLATNDPARMGEWLLALLAAWFLSSLILLSATGLKRLLGRRGLIAMERLMGMLLIAVAVQMLLEGIAAYLKN